MLYLQLEMIGEVASATVVTKAGYADNILKFQNNRSFVGEISDRQQ